MERQIEKAVKFCNRLKNLVQDTVYGREVSAMWREHGLPQNEEQFDGQIHRTYQELFNTDKKEEAWARWRETEKLLKHLSDNGMRVGNSDFIMSMRQLFKVLKEKQDE